MRPILTALAGFTGLFISSGCAHRLQDVPAPPHSGSDTPAPHVLNIVMTDEHTVLVEGLPMATSNVTARLIRMDPAYDAIAVYGPVSGGRGLQSNTPLLAELAAKGLPLLVVDHASPADVAQKLLLTPEHLSRLKRSTAKPENGKQDAAGSLTAKPSLRWSSDDATLELRRVEVGRQGRSVWIIHEEDESGAGTSGIQIKKAW